MPCPVFVLARPTRPSCAGARPQELNHWICSQILRLSPGIAFGSECQMCRGSNLDSNLNSSAWPTGCKGFLRINCVEFWVLFRSVENAEIEDSSELISNLIHQTVCYNGWNFYLTNICHVNNYVACVTTHWIISHTTCSFVNILIFI